MSVHTKSGREVKSNGPGWSPYCWNAASSTAAVAEDGSPSVSNGTSTPAAAALLAASGTATPSIAPWPKRSGSLLNRFSMAYDTKVGITVPPHGRTPGEIRLRYLAANSPTTASTPRDSCR